MVKETHSKVLRLITDPPRIPEFYTITKIHKPTITGRPIISGCDGPTERISFFVDTLLQPISKIQKSYLQDTTDFINVIENTKVKKRTFLVSMDVTSLYTNIPQNEGIEIVCKAYENFYKDNPPIPEKVKNSSPKKLLANSWPTWPTVVYCLLRKSSANSRPTFGSMSVICWPSVGWEPLSNTRKASARRKEHCISTRNETFSLESAILFRIFRHQSPRSLLCLGFLGTKPRRVLRNDAATYCRALSCAPSCWG